MVLVQFSFLSQESLREPSERATCLAGGLNVGNLLHVSASCSMVWLWDTEVPLSTPSYQNSAIWRNLKLFMLVAAVCSRAAWTPIFWDAGLTKKPVAAYAAADPEIEK